MKHANVTNKVTEIMEDKDDEILEKRFDFGKAERNPYAGKLGKQCLPNSKIVMQVNPDAERIDQIPSDQFGNLSATEPASKPTAIGGMSRNELDAELEKGIESLRNGRMYTLEEVDAELAELVNARL